MRARSVYVRSMMFRLPVGGRRDIRAAAARDERKVTAWVTRVVRAALARKVDPPEPDSTLTEKQHVELPGELVDALRDRVGQYNMGRFVSAAVLAALARESASA
jgi:hypothetical protein